MRTKSNQKGFTIIEVLIVLAIAAVIMLVVFLAVPALQRNNRNSSRRSDISHLGGIVSEQITNNGGAYPTAITQGNERFSAGFTFPAAYTVLPGVAPKTATVDAPVVYKSAKCTDQTTIAAGTARQTAIWYAVESNSGGSTVQCQEV